jgi:hypothetical protein
MPRHDYSLLEPGEETWDQRTLARLPPGVDLTLIEENLKLTPDQRLKNMIAVLESLDRGFGARDA